MRLTLLIIVALFAAQMEQCEEKVFTAPMVINGQKYPLNVTFGEGEFRMRSEQKNGTQLSILPPTYKWANDPDMSKAMGRKTNKWDDLNVFEQSGALTYLYAGEVFDYFDSVQDTLTGVAHFGIQIMSGVGLTKSIGNEQSFTVNLYPRDVSLVVVAHEMVHGYISWRKAGSASWQNRAVQEGMCDILAIAAEDVITGTTLWRISGKGGGFAPRYLSQKITYDPKYLMGMPHNGGRILGHWAYRLHKNHGVPIADIGQMVRTVINEDLAAFPNYDIVFFAKATIRVGDAHFEEYADAVKDTWAYLKVPI